MGAHPSCPGPYNLVVVREGRNVSLGLCLYGGMGVGGAGLWLLLFTFPVQIDSIGVGIRVLEGWSLKLSLARLSRAFQMRIFCGEVLLGFIWGSYWWFYHTAGCMFIEDKWL